MISNDYYAISTEHRPKKKWPINNIQYINNKYNDYHLYLQQIHTNLSWQNRPIKINYFKNKIL